jgi:hypothetical protein
MRAGGTPSFLARSQEDEAGKQRATDELLGALRNDAIDSILVSAASRAKCVDWSQTHSQLMTRFSLDGW